MSAYVYRVFRGHSAEERVAFLEKAKAEGLEYVEGFILPQEHRTVLDDGAKVLFRVVGVPVSLNGPRVSIQHNGRIIEEVSWNPKGDDVLTFHIAGRDDLFAVCSWSKVADGSRVIPDADYKSTVEDRVKILGPEGGWTGSQNAFEVGVVAEAVWGWCEKQKAHGVLALEMTPRAVHVALGRGAPENALLTVGVPLQAVAKSAFEDARRNPRPTPVGLWFKAQFRGTEDEPPEQEEITRDRLEMCTEIVDGALRSEMPTGHALTPIERTARQVAINWCDTAAMYACNSEYWKKRALEAEAKLGPVPVAEDRLDLAVKYSKEPLAGGPYEMVKRCLEEASKRETEPAPAPMSDEELKAHIQKELDKAFAPFVGKPNSDELMKEMVRCANETVERIREALGLDFGFKLPDVGKMLDELCEGLVVTEEELRAWERHLKVFPGTALEDFLPAWRGKNRP